MESRFRLGTFKTYNEDEEDDEEDEDDIDRRPCEI
jgi:hypothetical protein